MENIYSEVEKDKLLHIIVRESEIRSERINVIADEEYLQLAVMQLNKGKTFKPHKHIFHSKETKIAQESWVVIRGSVKVFLYDLDDSILREEVIYPGDASITLYGGHTYEILEDDTVVYEYKTGPYMGVELDKEFI
jgi:cupin fold WbuC family metalloprotein